MNLKKKKRDSYTGLIQDDIVSMMQKIIKQAFPEDNEVPIELREPKKAIDKYDSEEEKKKTKKNRFTPEVAAAVSQFWAHDRIKEASTSVLDDNFNHYGHELLENAEKIAEKGYTPSFNDILKMRRKTTGFGLTNIDTDEGERYQVMDVGGMRSERPKWNRHLAKKQTRNQHNRILCLIMRL